MGSASLARVVFDVDLDVPRFVAHRKCERRRAGQVNAAPPEAAIAVLEIPRQQINTRIDPRTGRA